MAAEQKRVACKYHAMGRCRAGASCKFSHSSATDAKPGSIPIQCRFFQQGLCRDGRMCPFQHQLPAPAPAPAPAATGSVSRIVRQPDNPWTNRKPPSPPPAEEAARQCADEEDEEDDEDEDDGPAGPPQPVEAPTVEWTLGTDDSVYFFGAPGAMQNAAAVEQERANDLNWGALLNQLSLSATSQPAEAPPVRDSRPACKFFLQGTCRYGNRCRNAHAQQDMTEEDVMQRAMEQSLAAEERRASADISCAICFEKVLETNGRFGILLGCDHPFCLPCIRGWRTQEEPGQSKEVLRSCPLCRVDTPFVVPCDRMVTDPIRKQALVDAYRTSLASVPCKHFDMGNGECPFGSSCLYAHRLRDGTEAPVPILRTYQADENTLEVLRPMSLAAFLPDDLS